MRPAIVLNKKFLAPCRNRLLFAVLGASTTLTRRDIVESTQSVWQTAAILIARLIFAAVFLMAVSFKFMDIGATAGYIVAAGFPLPLFLAWCAAALEIGRAHV